MATLLNLGSLLLDGILMRPGSQYQPGQGISFGDGGTISWIAVNGLLIADRPLLVNISWDDLNTQNLIFGTQVTINDQPFICRLLKVWTDYDEPNEWDTALDVVGEANDLLHWRDAYCWGQERLDTSSCALRGFISAREDYWSLSSDRDPNFGFRPTLELLPSNHLGTGDRICAFGGQSILYGTLLSLTAYDAVILPESASKMSKSDDGCLYKNLSDGTIVLDRSRVTVQVIDE